MKENKAEEKLRVVDIIKENTGLVISIGGFIWLMFQFVILPIYKLQYDVANILGNHLATIQTQLTEAKSEREAQGKLLISLSEQIIRLQILIEKK
jgi:hypothetical protein